MVLSRESKDQSAAPAVAGTPVHSPEESMMDNLMQSPFFQSLMENPEVLRSLLESNPYMAKVMEENPELRQALRDPEHLQQIFRAMRNPNLRREMTRNMDRVIANANAMPGGFDALQYVILQKYYF